MHLQEHAPLPALTASMLQMLDYRLADVAGQRELVGWWALPSNDDPPGAPIEIVEPQSRDFDRAQSHPC